MTDFEVVASNIQGQGALEVVASLLPALERVRPPRRIWLPAAGPLRNYESPAGVAAPITRRLPNAVSRVVECVASARYYRGAANRLVLGDLPLRVTGRQVVFVHNTFVLAGRKSSDPVQSLKAVVSRMLFRVNQHRIHRAIVQTSVMAEELIRTYPLLRDRTTVIPQPPPQWLLGHGVQRTGRASNRADLRLFYPAAAYAHKNHSLLWSWLRSDGGHDCQLHVTLPQNDVPDHLPAVTCHGRLEPAGMVSQYSEADALVFPSLEESYGLPLVEALFLDLPILAADVPYARAVCRDAAIYFDPQSPASLAEAVSELRDRLKGDWWPDYSAQRSAFTLDWDEVARRMVAQFDSD